MVNSTGRFILSFTSHFVLVFLSPFTIAITLYREELVSVLFMRLSVLCALVCVSFLFVLVPGMGCDLFDGDTPGLFFVYLFAAKVSCFVCLVIGVVGL